jgi:pimeloyl-ACP methyl ester carboxylesterase
MDDVVLVHGGWHGGWIWERLIPLLAVAGHRVHAPTLSGLGERAAAFTPDIGLQTHVDDVLAVVEPLGPHPVTLIGHSYGGGLIAAVADRMPDRVACLVFVDALIPTDGVPGWPGFPKARRDAMLAAARDLDGRRVPPPDPSFWGLVPGTPEYAHIRMRLTPHPLKTMLDRPRISGSWKRVKNKCYLLAADTPSQRFRDHHAALAAEPGWVTDVVPGGHELMWTHPQALAQALLSCMASRA